MLGTTAAAAPKRAPVPSSGTFAGYEGAEVSGYSLAINVHKGIAVPGVTGYGYKFNPADPANRFLWIKPLSGPYATATAPFGGTLKVAAYAPDGKPTNLVLPEAAGNHVTLQPYDPKNVHQVWAPEQYAGDLGRAGWVADAGAGKMIRAAVNNRPLELVPAAHWTGTMFTWNQIRRLVHLAGSSFAQRFARQFAQQFGRHFAGQGGPGFVVPEGCATHM